MLFLQMAMLGPIQHLVLLPLPAVVTALEMQEPELLVALAVLVVAVPMVQTVPVVLAILQILVRLKEIVAVLAEPLQAVMVVEVVVPEKSVTRMELVMEATVLRSLFLVHL
jgi:hypothetical protein